jgi:uncharacterized membrane protein YjgN (DUF898 family)
MEEPASAVSAKPMEFRGAGREYFGIWIVNLLLSILTLGFYIPWARVRTRRYFHRNTYLDGHSFDYVADPRRLLIGYVIVGAFFIIYLVSGTISPLLALPVILLFWIVLPWVRYKSARFFASNTTYRNIRLRFDGTLGGAYAAYMGWPMLGMVSLGLLTPLSSFKKAEYIFGHLAFGNFRSAFTGRMGWFFKVIYILLGVGVAGFVGFAVVMEMAFAASGTAHSGGGANEPAAVPPWFMGLLFLIYGFMFLLFGVWLVLSKNYGWSHLVLSPPSRSLKLAEMLIPDLNRSRSRENAQLVFRSDLKVARYLWIVVSNIVLTILTLGLFTPFAAVRLHRYRVVSLSVGGVEALDDVVAEASSEQNAIGESATELFDLEFGL